MKIYEKQEIENCFQEAMKVSETEGVKAKDLGVFFGSLAVAIASRIAQLKTGVAKSTNLESELAKLRNAQDCLTAKINTASVEVMAAEIMAAYKASD